MRFQARVFMGQALAFAAGAVFYLLGAYDNAGLFLLVTCAIFGGWLAIWLRRTADGEPRFDAPVSAGPIGTFPSGSRWTPAVGLAIVVLVNGVIAGPWLAGIGAVLLLVSVIGYSFEFLSNPRQLDGTEP